MECFLPSNSKSQLQSRSKINGQTAKFAGKYNFLGIREVLNLAVKSLKTA